MIIIIHTRSNQNQTKNKKTKKQKKKTKKNSQVTLVTSIFIWIIPKIKSRELNLSFSHVIGLLSGLTIGLGNGLLDFLVLKWNQTLSTASLHCSNEHIFQAILVFEPTLQ